MTLLHMDSFEMGDTTLRYAGANLARQASAGRNGRACSRSSGSTAAVKTFTATGTVISGVASADALQMSFWADSNTVQHITIHFTSAGLVEVRRGAVNGTLLTSASTGLLHAAGQFQYLEAKVTVADSGGTVEVRINGSTTPLINFTGDTRNGGTSTNIDAVRVAGNSQCDLNDWYICNGSGSVNNNFLGDIRVYPLMPNGNGSSSQLVGSDGNSTDNYLLVDEKPYSTTDYNGSSTAGNRDMYTIENLPSNVVSVLGVQEISIAAKSDAGAISGKQVIRPSTTNYASASLTLSTTYALFSTLREQNPDTTAAWAISEVNATEIGWEVA